MEFMRGKMNIRINTSLCSYFPIPFPCVLLFILSFYCTQAQQKCGTFQYNNQLMEEGEPDFEKWVSEKANNDNKRIAQKAAGKYQIRVVVHVIHSGEPEGVGSNVSQQQIASQITVLNKDFNRLNSDTVDTPSEFKPVAGKLNIEFVLSAVKRVRGTKTSWTIKDNSELKSLSYLAAEDYLNIWVCNLTDYFGYTQFPISTLPGIANSSRNRLTDGIIISSKVFGSSDFGNFNLRPGYSKGRTAVHEMGHFFGLRHLWGDVGDCKGTDYVNDTPTQSESTNGCPPHPLKDCNSDRMFQNYLDFTDDACMNLFTNGQVERMTIVLENSPRRASLLLPLEKSDEFAYNKIFSPNGDGVNDFWKWTNTTSYQGCTLSVFNRFGKKVYEIVSYDNSWDGRSQEGVPLEAEAYYFILSCPNKDEITGGVRIVR
jgi:gliding motility-associated-like protein